MAGVKRTDQEIAREATQADSLVGLAERLNYTNPRQTGLAMSGHILQRFKKALGDKRYQTLKTKGRPGMKWTQKGRRLEKRYAKKETVDVRAKTDLGGLNPHQHLITMAVDPGAEKVSGETEVNGGHLHRFEVMIKNNMMIGTTRRMGGHAHIITIKLDKTNDDAPKKD